MNCPNCGQELKVVSLTSNCVQSVIVDKNGVFISFDTPEVQDSIVANCQECYEEINLGIDGMCLSILKDINYNSEEKSEIGTDEEDEDSFDRDWCDFCQMSVIADEKGNCTHCGNKTE